MTTPAERVADRISVIPKLTVWTEFSPLAVEHQAINLGQGFPSFAPEPFITECGVACLADTSVGMQQYCRNAGHLDLVNRLRARYSATLQRDVGEMEITTTNGCTQALNLAINCLVNKGDEVIVMEPYFDVYKIDLDVIGGELTYVSVKPAGATANDWTLDMAELRAAVTPKTKVIMFNTPQNVPGKVWSRAEMDEIAAIAIEFDLFVISDEVYDRLTFDGCEHVAIASLPGMYDRTLTLCSSAKTLTATGWKIGWAVGPAPVVKALMQLQASQTFCVCTPLQVAVGNALELAEGNGYYARLTADYVERRDVMAEVLRAAGLTPVMPQGAFFMLADISAFDPAVYVDAASGRDIGLDWHFCRWMTAEIGVSAIPVSAFCSKASRPMYEKYVRFAFSKPVALLREAGERLQKLKQYRRQ
jgi:kynurenine--oxoglutarate transaminase/cysteine-S-conjugate beta-lyase/glutamine--phenylpyruvate transaminase